MPTASLRILRTAAAFAALAGLSQAQAISCDELRATVEEKIRSKGVKSFQVTVVEAGSAQGGRIVGSCDRGARQLVYLPSSAPPASSPRAAPPAKTEPPARPGVVTECADGRVITSGHCKR